MKFLNFSLKLISVLSKQFPDGKLS